MLMTVRLPLLFVPKTMHRWLMAWWVLALEESFEKERREIKRGATGTAGKGGKKAAKVSKKSVK